METFKIKHTGKDNYAIFILLEDWFFLSETSSIIQAYNFIDNYCKRNKIENKIIY